jgi:ankyrin repeat protein
LEGHIDIVKLLLQKRADTTIANNDGLTPLNVAASEGHTNIVNLLLENAANLILVDGGG